jgi:hypothetical protein
LATAPSTPLIFFGYSWRMAQPPELPDGTQIELLPVPVDDDLDPQERARLLQAIDEGIEDFERGDHMDGFDFIAQLRARRERRDLPSPLPEK